MPAPLDARKKSEIVDRLFAVFRDRGYAGCSLADLSEATGLGKSSLYHHFPGGKEQMAEVVLEQGKEFLQSALADVANAQEPLASRIARIVKAFDQMYDGGRNPCLLGKMAMADLGAAGRQLTQDVFELWTAAIASLARSSGMPAARARRFAEDWIARLQGSLILHAANGDRRPFARTMRALTELAGKQARPARSGR